MNQNPPYSDHIGSSSGLVPSDCPLYHQMYMDHFVDLHRNYSNLHTTIQPVNTRVDSLTIDFQGLKHSW